jgi:hypothetical protein
VVSVQEQENKQSDYNSAIARLNSASADVDADQGDVDRLQALAGFKNITAPFDGVVTARETDIGALINAGSGTGGGPELFRVADIHKMRIYVQVPQQMSAGIRSGLTADLRLPQYPDKIFHGGGRHHIKRHQPQCTHAAGRALRGKSGRPAAARRLRAGRFSSCQPIPTWCASRRARWCSASAAWKSPLSGRAIGSSSSRSRSGAISAPRSRC